MQLGRNLKVRIYNKRLAFVVLFFASLIFLSGIFISVKWKKKDTNSTNKQLDQQVYLPPVIEYVEPIITGNVLTSPVITRNGIAQILRFTTLPGWKFESYHFEKCPDGTLCQYDLRMVNTLKDSHKINFHYADAGFGTCYFGSDQTSDVNLHSSYIPVYKTVKTGFGTVRVDKPLNKQDGSDLNYYFVCQNNVSRHKNKSRDWISVTEIGFVYLTLPDSYDERLYKEMIAILSSTTNTLVKVTSAKD